MREGGFASDARLAYLDALRPPPGWRLGAALGTTYSLDLEALLASVVALVGLGGNDLELKRNRVLRALLREGRDRVLVVAQRGRSRAGASGQPKPLYALLDRILREAPFDEEVRSFHPKVWLARYDGTGPSVYRLLVTSRNLTRDRAWDHGVLLEGEEGRARSALGEDVQAFVEAVSGAASVTGEGAVRELLGRPLSRVAWQLPKCASSVRLRFRADGRGRLIDLQEKTSALAVVSPFVDKTGLAVFERGPKERVLVSTDAALGELAARARDALDPWRLTSLPVPRETELDEKADPEERDDDELGLHAKIYAARGEAGATLWIGSANATGRGLAGANAEALLELTVDEPAVGALEDWIARHARDFIPPAEVPAPDEAEKEARALEAARRAFCARNFLLDRRGTPSEIVATPAPEFDGVSVWVARATAGVEVAWPSGTARIALPTCAFHEETELLRVRMRRGEAELRFVLRAAAEPALADSRDAALRRSLGVRGFLEYLRDLMKDEPDDDEDAGWDEPVRRGRGEGGAIAIPPQFTLEALLRSCGGDEGRLAQLDEEVRVFLDGADEDGGLSPEDRELLARFEKFWRVVSGGLGSKRS